MGAALLGPIKRSRADTSRSMPPDREMIFISMPTPSTIRITFQGTPETAFLSCPQPMTLRTPPIRKPVRPTFHFSASTPTASSTRPSRLRICCQLNRGRASFASPDSFLSTRQPL